MKKKEYDNCENENEMKEYKKIKNFCFIKNLKYCFEKQLNFYLIILDLIHII